MSAFIVNFCALSGFRSQLPNSFSTPLGVYKIKLVEKIRLVSNCLDCLWISCKATFFVCCFGSRAFLPCYKETAINKYINL